MRTVERIDENGNVRGVLDLYEAHTGEGTLHRAFSVYIFRNGRDEVLIQKRSAKKMLFAGMWANTCCSHPQAGENILVAGTRRLQEECGFACPLFVQGTLVYRAEDPEGKGVEHEHVTLLVGEVQDAPYKPDPTEIEEMQWIAVRNLLETMESNPSAYAPWFHLGLEKIVGEA